MKVFGSKWFLCFLVIILALVVWFLYKQFIVKNYLDAKLSNLEAKISNLGKENEMMENELLNLENPESLEGIARRLYVLKKPGEEAMVMPEELLNPSPTPAPTPLKNFFGNFWGKVKSIFQTRQ